MIDLAKLDESLLIARGSYSSVRSEHEDQLKRLQILSGQLQSAASQVLKRMQPDGMQVPEPVDSLIAEARLVLKQMEDCSKEIISLAEQRKELYPRAWPK